MREINRRRLLERTGSTVAAGGLLLGSIGSASATDCESGVCSGYDGDIITIQERNGRTAHYRIEVMDGAIYDCFPETTDGHYYGHDGKGMSFAYGSLDDETVKWYISGSHLNRIRVCDISDPGAWVTLDVDQCPDHCTYGYGGWMDATVTQLTDSNSAVEPLCSNVDSYSTGESEYYFCTTAGIEPESDIESDDEEVYSSCAEGYLRNGDRDVWEGNGIVRTYSVQPDGSDVDFHRYGNEGCVAGE